MIVDAHTHIHPDIRGFGATRDASAASLVRDIKAAGISRAVVLAIEPEMGNAFIAQQCTEYPELVGFVSLDPLDPASASETINTYLAGGLMHGVKLHPRRQGFGIMDVRAVIALVENVSTYNVPILIDAFAYGASYYSIEEVRLIHEVAAAVPQARIIMAHAGGKHVLEALMVLKGNKNVMVDVSFTPFWFAGSSVYSDLVFVMRKIGPNRILHGSDSPEVSVARALSDTLSLCSQCGFNASEQELILGGNFMNLYPSSVFSHDC